MGLRDGDEVTDMSVVVGDSSAVGGVGADEAEDEEHEDEDEEHEDEEEHDASAAGGTMLLAVTSDGRPDHVHAMPAPPCGSASPAGPCQSDRRLSLAPLAPPAVVVRVSLPGLASACVRAPFARRGVEARG